jgi:tetratricopeptide (TPR) repeat protein
MPPSIIEKYEQILAADPRSRIFVELAKALVDRGEAARAAEVCRHGLEHHASSILGRVVLGRALLELGDDAAALAQLEAAVAVDPSSPYAFNLVGEALVAKKRHAEALPYLERALELQPADARIRGWLEHARRNLGAAPQPGPRAEPEEDDEKTVALRMGAIPTPAVTAPDGEAKAVPIDREAARPEHGGTASAPDRSRPQVSEGAEEPSRPPPPVLSRVAAPAPGPNPGSEPGAPVTPPPLRSPATPPPLRSDSSRSVLYMIPDESTRDVIGPSATRPSTGARAPAGSAPDAAEAERLAQQFAEELRQRLLAETPPPAPSRLRRSRRLLGAAALVLAIGAAAAVYLVADARRATALAATAGVRARAGLARDTVGSLREAARLLSDARRASDDPELVSLSAQVAAVLAAEHGDGDARRLAEELVRDPRSGDGGRAAEYLLATTPGEVKDAEASLLDARPSSAPLVQALAGRVLVARGEVEAGRGRLEIAARTNPPLLRALSDLADLALRTGDTDRALTLYGAALGAHPTHPRSVVGAAEARLALGKDLDVAARELAAVDADPGSAPPQELRVRFELASARVAVARGEPAAAAARLARASEALGETAPLAAALAEAHLAARAWERAEGAAARAVELDPSEVSHRLLLARARLGRGKPAEALAALARADGRAVRIQRAIARLRLGQLGAARKELEATGRDGRMPAEAAVWYALTDVALGRAARARALLERLAQARTPPPLVHAALGRALEAEGNLAGAERAYRAAIEREPFAPEGPTGLGRVLVARGMAKDALAPLEDAVRLDPADLETRRALGEARLAAGLAGSARAELDAVLLARPNDVPALTLLSAAWLAQGEPREARRAADRAVTAAPRDARALLAAARAAQVAGDHADAKPLAARALKAGLTGSDAVEARMIAAFDGKHIAMNDAPRATRKISSETPKKVAATATKPARRR